jgi:hypothetical protein
MALEIKWSDRYADQPGSLKGLVRFASNNSLPSVWATTRNRIGTSTIGDSKIHQWPAAALAFHYGVQAVRGRLADYEAQIREISNE